MRGRRLSQIVLITAAWIGFGVSLPTPAIRYAMPYPGPFTIFQSLGWDPVGLIVVVSFLQLRTGLSAIGALTALSVVTLALSPLVLIPAGRLVAFVERIAALFLLGAWSLPLSYYAGQPQPGGWHCTGIAWGYFIFGGAGTLALIAIQIGPSPPARDGRMGFPVVEQPPLPRGG
jgi:hypothetical protein